MTWSSLLLCSPLFTVTCDRRTTNWNNLTRKTTLIVGMGRKPCLLLRFLDYPTTKPRDGSTAQFIKVSRRYSKTPFLFRSAINMLLLNVILRCNEVSHCLTIEDFYSLKTQTWGSVGKCTVRLVRTLQVTDVSIPFFRWFNNLRNYNNISSLIVSLEIAKKILTISYQQHYFYCTVLCRIYSCVYKSW